LKYRIHEINVTISETITVNGPGVKRDERIFAKNSGFGKKTMLYRGLGCSDYHGY